MSALTFDPALGRVVARAGVPVVLMHARGTPATMQDDPRYDDVLLDVYDVLAARIACGRGERGSRATGSWSIPASALARRVAHNLALMRGLSLFHGLGCPILLGASRKRFIGTVGRRGGWRTRVPGSLAVALDGRGAGGADSARP